MHCRYKVQTRSSHATKSGKKMPTESATRKEIIDLRLKEAGWNVADRTQVIAEFLVSSGAVAGNTVTLHRARNRPPSPREFSDHVLLGKTVNPSRSSRPIDPSRTPNSIGSRQD